MGLAKKKKKTRGCSLVGQRKIDLEKEITKSLNWRIYIETPVIPISYLLFLLEQKSYVGS